MSEYAGQTAKRQDPLRSNLWFLLELVIVLLLALLIRRYVFTLTIVSGSSMEETLHDHQVVAVSKIHYAFQEPARGDVVICHYPDSDKNFVKRVVAIEGDTIEITSGNTYVNGKMVEEDFITYKAQNDFGPATIGKGEVFVMGDNRANSHDSRAEGPLPMELLQGRVFAVVYPFGEWHWIGFDRLYPEGS